MIQDIKPGSQSMSPSLIILGQSIVYAEVVAKQTGPNRRNNRFSLHLMSAIEIVSFGFLLVCDSYMISHSITTRLRGPLTTVVSSVLYDIT